MEDYGLKIQAAYGLIKPGQIKTRIEASMTKGWTKFVGRQKEMRVLKASFDKAHAGKGQVAGIVGEAGMGKSRLLSDIR